VSALVSLCVNLRVDPVAPAAGQSNEQTDKSGDVAGAEPVSAPEADEAEKKARFTRSYIASELLSADVRPLADALVGDNDTFDALFSCLEANAPGELDNFVATHFAKIISSLLKTRNDETLAQMARRRNSFVSGLLKHLALPAIADIVVRVLDGPEVDRGYSSMVVAPSPAALDLLVAADVLSGLADRFVECAKPAAESSSEPTNLRRLREEAMMHATLAIQGIATRVLQLPALGMQIPAMLSPYATPSVVLRMLNAGLDAYDSGSGSGSSGGGGGPPPTSPSADESGASGAAAASTSGTSAALLHALTLASTLMTTEANVVRDESADVGGPMGGAPGMPGGGAGSRQMMLGIGARGRPGGAYGAGRGAGGIGASIQAQRQREFHNNLDCDDSDDDEDDGAAARQDTGGGGEAVPLAPPADQPEIGSSIVSTASLEAELVGRFERLSEMFGTDANDEAAGRPLGSLRLKLAEFFVACMKKSSQSTVDAIVKLGVPRKLTELFLRYEWSSMLHGVVTGSIVSAFGGQPGGAPARKAWIDASLVKWLTDAWALNERRAAEEEFRFRAGYMGHLIQLGAELQRYVNDQAELAEDSRESVIPPDQLATLEAFAENHLGPAHKVEVTPLCERPGQGGGMSDGEEVYEEATEVFDMGEVMEGLTQGDANQGINRFAKYLTHRTEADEEEVETVEVGDLSHFGGEDDDEVSPVGIDDSDIPAEMRAALQGRSATAAPPPVAPPPAMDNLAMYLGGRSAETAVSAVASPLPSPTGGAVRSLGDDDLEQPSIVDTELTSGEFEAALVESLPAAGGKTSQATFGESSDDDGDGGTYEEFVDAPDGDALSAVTANKVKSGRSPPPPSASSKNARRAPAPAAADVIEIDDGEECSCGFPSPPTAAATAAAAADVTVLDDGDDSSGEEDEWTTFDVAAAAEPYADTKGEGRVRTGAK
jgi:hypothetical protein